jgi:hypothetical protein
MHGYENMKLIKKKVKCNTGGPLYPQIQYLQFQLSAVYCGLIKKFGKLKQ